MSFRTNQFKKELIELCLKYDCEIEAENHFTGYAECGSDIRMTVHFNGQNVDGEYIPYEDLDLGNSFDGN
jgi:hypothetical protein